MCISVGVDDIGVIYSLVVGVHKLVQHSWDTPHTAHVVCLVSLDQHQVGLL